MATDVATKNRQDVAREGLDRDGLLTNLVIVSGHISSHGADGQPAADDEPNTHREEQVVVERLAVALDHVVQVQNVVIHDALNHVEEAPPEEE